MGSRRRCGASGGGVGWLARATATPVGFLSVAPSNLVFPLLTHREEFLFMGVPEVHGMRLERVHSVVQSTLDNITLVSITS
jgi:hypothetical protein